MNFLALFSQGLSGYLRINNQTTTLSPAEVATATMALMIFVVFMLIFLVIAYIFFSVTLMFIFNKAGVPKWIAWVPFYNSWKLLEIGGQPGFWAVLSVVPIFNLVTAVFIYIAQYHIGKKLGKGGEFVLWAIFLPAVWYIWLAVDKSTYKDSASSAPSLHKS